MNDNSLLIFLDEKCYFSPLAEGTPFQQLSEICVIPYSPSKLKLNSP